MLAVTAGLQPASDSADLEDAEVDFKNLATEQPAPVRRKLSRLVRVSSTRPPYVNSSQTPPTLCTPSEMHAAPSSEHRTNL